METKRLGAIQNLETKVEGQAGHFSGYASVFGNTDANGDVVDPGAFAKTIADAQATKSRTGYLWSLLWMHDESNPVGGITDAREDKKGLYISGMCDLDTDAGRRAFSGLKKGYAAEMSIGYAPVKSTHGSGGARHLLQIKLFEISLITMNYAANPQALVDSAGVKTRKEEPMPSATYRVLTSRKVLEVPTEPERKNFAEGWRGDLDFNNAVLAYEDDCAAWLGSIYETKELSVHELALADRDERTAERKAALIEHERAYFASGLASAREMLAHHRATGWTPSGAPLDAPALVETKRLHAAYADQMERAVKGKLTDTEKADVERARARES